MFSLSVAVFSAQLYDAKCADFHPGPSPQSGVSGNNVTQSARTEAHQNPTARAPQGRSRLRTARGGAAQAEQKSGGVTGRPGRLRGCSSVTANGLAAGVDAHVDALLSNPG
ncbi:hypothetical protein ILYODFUR_018849 [Ilyodon furcidens]|uniref:Uncharacterized protein n=1 Tax=Ilyodon furcidens TaxID=33524 RepID=A0ABV0SNA9_9TELE